MPHTQVLAHMLHAKGEGVFGPLWLVAYCLQCLKYNKMDIFSLVLNPAELRNATIPSELHTARSYTSSLGVEPFKGGCCTRPHRPHPNQTLSSSHDEPYSRNSAVDDHTYETLP